jgi:hypothetical protein
MSIQAGVVPNPRLDLERPDPENRNAPGYERLLDAVLCLLVESGTAALADGFKPDDVARRAGKSRASYYRTEGFPAGDVLNSESRVAVLEAAIDRALHLSAVDVNRRYETVDDDIAGGRVLADPGTAIRVSCEADFGTVKNALLSVRLYAAALAPSSMNVEASLRSHYDALTDSLVDAYDKVLRHWGYWPRRPLDLRQFVITMLGVADGLILRYCADETVDAPFYAEAMAAVAVGLLEPVNGASQPNDNRPEGDAGRLLAAPPKLEAASSVEWVRQIEVALDSTAAGGSTDWLQVLRSALDALATCAVGDTAATRAVLTATTGIAAGESREAPSDGLLALIEKLLNDAALQGTFRAPSTRSNGATRSRNALFAQALVSTVLTVVLGQQDPEIPSSEGHAAWCAEYVWDLLVQPYVIVG